MDFYNTAKNSPKITRSQIVLDKYGVPISSAKYITNNYWNIPKRFLDLFKTYYILRWNISYYNSVFQNGTITRNDITYQVIYHKTDPIEVAKCSNDVYLSFRELQTEYGSLPTVLVSLVKD